MNEIYALDISTVFNHKTYLAYLPQAYRESVPYDTLLPMLPVLVTKFVRMEGDSVDLVFKANGRPLQLGGNASQFGTIKSDGVTLTTSAELVVLSLVKDLGITFDLSKLTRLGVEVICAEQSYYTERQITPALVDAYKQITYPVDPAQAVADLEPRFIQISADVKELTGDVEGLTGDVEEISRELDNAEEQLSETSPNLIKNRAVYNQYMNGGDIEEIEQIIYPEEERPFTIEIIDIDATSPNHFIQWKNTTALQYNKNKGGWLTTDPNTEIEVIKGDIVEFKGNTPLNITTVRTAFFSSGVSLSIRGNIMSLIGGDNFASLRDVTGNKFRGLFYTGFNEYTTYDDALCDASKLVLPATTLSSECYKNMFNNCRNLEVAPKILPATTLAEQCYLGMFSNCAKLTTAPELPAMNLALSCYNNMFTGCSSLVNAPALPATTLAQSCYAYMFYATAIVKAPALPAETLTPYCYTQLFGSCASLKEIECRAVDKSATNALNNWVSNVGTSGIFKKVSGVSWGVGASGVPSGWTVEDITE